MLCGDTVPTSDGGGTSHVDACTTPTSDMTNSVGRTPSRGSIDFQGLAVEGAYPPAAAQPRSTALFLSNATTYDDGDVDHPARQYSVDELKRCVLRGGRGGQSREKSTATPAPSASTNQSISTLAAFGNSAAAIARTTCHGCHYTSTPAAHTSTVPTNKTTDVMETAVTGPNCEADGGAASFPRLPQHVSLSGSATFRVALNTLGQRVATAVTRKCCAPGVGGTNFGFYAEERVDGAPSVPTSGDQCDLSGPGNDGSGMTEGTENKSVLVESDVNDSSPAIPIVGSCPCRWYVFDRCCCPDDVTEEEIRSNAKPPANGRSSRGSAVDSVLGEPTLMPLLGVDVRAKFHLSDPEYDDKQRVAVSLKSTESGQEDSDVDETPPMQTLEFTTFVNVAVHHVRDEHARQNTVSPTTAGAGATQRKQGGRSGTRTLCGLAPVGPVGRKRQRNDVNYLALHNHVISFK